MIGGPSEAEGETNRPFDEMAEGTIDCVHALSPQSADELQLFTRIAGDHHARHGAIDASRVLVAASP
jgi:hypothetical protein